MQPIEQVALENSFGNSPRLLLRSAKRKRAYTLRRQQPSLFAIVPLYVHRVRFCCGTFGDWTERELSPRNGHACDASQRNTVRAPGPSEVHAMRLRTS